VLAIGVSLDKPADDPERRIAIINDAGHAIGTVPVYSQAFIREPTQIEPLRRRLQLPLKPTVHLWGFHRIDQPDHHLMDVIASRAFERPDVII
jgi:hypothetical protein